MTLTNADVQHCLDQLVAAEFQNDRWDFSCLSPKGRKPVSDVWFMWAKTEMEACPPVLEIKKQNSPEFRNTVIFYSRLFRVASSYYFFVSENFSMPAYRFLEFSIEIATLHNFIDREKINDQCNRLVSIFCLQNYLLSNERTEPGGGMMDFLRLTPKGRAAFAEWSGTEEPPIECPENEIPDKENKVPKSLNQHKTAKKTVSEFERNFFRLIEGDIGRQYDDDGNLVKATIDGKVILFTTSALGKVAKVVFGGIAEENAFTKETIEFALDSAGLKRSGRKKVIEILEASVVKAKYGQLLKGPDKPKVFIHDPGRSNVKGQQYITKLHFE